MNLSESSDLKIIHIQQTSFVQHLLVLAFQLVLFYLSSINKSSTSDIIKYRIEPTDELEKKKDEDQLNDESESERVFLDTERVFLATYFSHRRGCHRVLKFCTEF